MRGARNSSNDGRWIGIECRLVNFRYRGPRLGSGAHSSHGGRLSRMDMTPELLNLIAGRFKALSDPVRLQILNALRSGEKSVTDLIEETGCAQANVSKHLQILHSLGFVARKKEGLYVYYRLSGREIFQLCDIMCGRIEKELKLRQKLFA